MSQAWHSGAMTEQLNGHGLPGELASLYTHVALPTILDYCSDCRDPQSL